MLIRGASADSFKVRPWKRTRHVYSSVSCWVICNSEGELRSKLVDYYFCTKKDNFLWQVREIGTFSGVLSLSLSPSPMLLIVLSRLGFESLYSGRRRQTPTERFGHAALLWIIWFLVWQIFAQRDIIMIRKSIHYATLSTSLQEKLQIDAKIRRNVRHEKLSRRHWRSSLWLEKKQWVRVQLHGLSRTVLEGDCIALRPILAGKPCRAKTRFRSETKRETSRMGMHNTIAVVVANGSC